MKRDLDLVRNILFDVEAAPAGQMISGFAYEGKDQPEILEHVAILIEAGYLDGQIVPGHKGQPLHAFVKRLTFQGHEFIAKARNNTLWKKVVSEAETKGVSTSMTIIDGILTKAAQKWAGLGDGD